MRMLMNWVKSVANRFDKVWINSAGWPIDIIGQTKPRTSLDTLYRDDAVQMVPLKKPVRFYGFFTLPQTQSFGILGIDIPDEMDIEVNPESIHKALGKDITVGLAFEIENTKWILLNISYKHHWFFGKRRLCLTCRRYEESFVMNGQPVNVQSRVT